MIVATAGHVDHGKSTLVAALTGQRTDRLPEEQRRGMTIEAGYAHAELGDGVVADFVDLPGHARYLHHLLAGIAAADVALLVVAADDGPMPQTHEHLDLLRALGCTRIVPVLTKGDRVDAGRRAAVRAAIRHLMAGRSAASRDALEAADRADRADRAETVEGAGDFGVLETCAPRGDGVQALREHLRALHDTLPPRDTGAGFRLAVDRLFVRAGAGLVATGTVLSGCVQVGDELAAAPAGGSLRVRGLQVHGGPVPQAASGQRCALNLVPNVSERAALERGDWLVTPALAVPTRRIDVRWWPAQPPDCAVKSVDPPPAASDALVRAALQLHLGNAVRNVRLVPLPSLTLSTSPSPLSRQPSLEQTGSIDALAPAAPAAPAAARVAGDDPRTHRYAQLLLDRPVIALHGDRFVLREPASRRLLGGGVVLDAAPPARGRARPQRLAELQALSAPTPAQALAGLLSARHEGIEARAFALNWNLLPSSLDRLAQQVGAVRVAHPGGLRLVDPRTWQRLLDEVPRRLARSHEADPSRRGLDDDALHRLLAAHGDAALRRAALGHLRYAGTIERDGFVWRLPGHVARLSAEDTALLQRVVAVMLPHGLRPPPLGDIAARLELPLPELAAFLQRAAALGHLVQVARNRFFLPATLQALVEAARETAAASPDGRFEVIPFRDRSGIGRNLSIQVLEHFDRMRITRFVNGRRSMADGAGA